MARQPTISFTTNNGRFRTLGEAVGDGLSRVEASIRGGARRNASALMNLFSDVWIDIVQSSTWVYPVPAARSTIITDKDIGQGRLVFGWKDFAGDAQTRFNLRLQVMRDFVNQTFNNKEVMSKFPLGVVNPGAFKQAAMAFRARYGIARALEAAEEDYWADVDRYDKPRLTTRRRIRGRR